MSIFWLWQSFFLKLSVFCEFGMGGGGWGYVAWIRVSSLGRELHLYFNRMFKRCTREYLQILLPCFPIGISYVWSFFPKWCPPKSFRIYLKFVYIWKAAIVVRNVFSLLSAEFFNFERKKTKRPAANIIAWVESVLKKMRSVHAQKSKFQVHGASVLDNRQHHLSNLDKNKPISRIESICACVKKTLNLEQRLTLPTTDTP